VLLILNEVDLKRVDEFFDTSKGKDNVLKVCKECAKQNFRHKKRTRKDS